MMQRIRCLFGRHKRDSKKVKIDRDDNPRSVCVGCGKPMVKEYPGATGVWRLED